MLATAHDMAREYRVITALRGTSVPVPADLRAVHGPGRDRRAVLRDGRRSTGTPTGPPTQLDAIGAGADPGHRDADDRDARRCCTRSIPAAVGLADFGRPEGFLARQVRRWKKQLDASRSRDLPGIDELHEAARRPDARRDPTPTIVHGDYRLDNVLVGPDDKVAAVLDWEMATLGDPLTDVGLLLVYQRMDRLETGYAVADGQRPRPAIPDAEEISASYAKLSGRDLSDLGFYIALGYVQDRR